MFSFVILASMYPLLKRKLSRWYIYIFAQVLIIRVEKVYLLFKLQAYKIM